MKEEIYKHDQVVLKPWDPKTRIYFRDEKTRLSKSLDISFELYHIGSTAVPGLGGKNIVDMLLLVSDENTARSLIETLESLGYNHNQNAGDKHRIFFNCNRNFNGNRIHMHLHSMWKTVERYEDHLIFRDYMRKHPLEANKYYSLKKQWAKKARHIREKYTEMKGDYITAVLKKARQENI